MHQFVFIGESKIDKFEKRKGRACGRLMQCGSTKGCALNFPAAGLFPFGADDGQKGRYLLRHQSASAIWRWREMPLGRVSSRPSIRRPVFSHSGCHARRARAHKSFYPASTQLGLFLLVCRRRINKSLPMSRARHWRLCDISIFATVDSADSASAKLAP
jgi:hypothetical protein